MKMLRPIYTIFVEDFLMVYKIMPRNLRRETITVLVNMVILAVFEVASLLSISILALSIASPEKILSSPIFQEILKKIPFVSYLFTDPRSITLFASLGVVLLIGVKNIMSAFVSCKTAFLGEKIALFTGKTIFKNFLYSPYIKHLSGSSSKIFQAMSWRYILGLFVTNLLTIYTYTLITIALLITLVSSTPEILLGTILAFVTISYIIYKSLKKVIDSAGIMAAKCAQEETETTMNAMNGIREVLIYRQQNVFLKKYEDITIKGIPSRTFLTLAPPIPSWILEVLGFAIIPVTICIMFFFYNSSIVQIAAALTMIMLICWRILPVLNRALSCLVALRSVRPQAMECISRVKEALSSPQYAEIAPDINFSIKGTISFDKISFFYPKSNDASLNNISFSLKCGTRVGIVGPSGAGKSTLVSILSGLIEPSIGNVLVDGKILSPEERAAYCMQVGYVPQSPYIMPGTLAANVAFSEWGKPYNSDRVYEACRMAALDLVDIHEKGIDIPIGEHGAGLSGGQAQRVSIARALYTKPKLLILDEATSALDLATESAIIETIHNLPNDITVVIIAHRLSTVKNCDYIIWINSGNIIDMGIPDIVLPHYEQALMDCYHGQKKC